MAEHLIVEVVYATPAYQFTISLKLLSPCTAKDAIFSSGILTRCPEIDLSKQKIGIYGKIVSLDTPLKSHDRVEIYRPLKKDPKQRRRERSVLKQRPYGKI